MKNYRLATKTETGAIVQFGPLMSMAIAEAKRQTMAKLTQYPVFVINVNAI